MFYWKAKSNDSCFEDKSTCLFKTKKEAYDDMRNAALNKMKWNTEFEEDFAEENTIDYHISFSKNSIVHNSYSGQYTYKIHQTL